MPGEETGYVYDAWGRRVQQTDLTGPRDSFYDRAGELIYQRDRAGGSHDYLYLDGHLIAIRDYSAQGIALGLRYQHTDALGSVIRQTDPTGAELPNTGVVYDAWGGEHGVSMQDGPGYTGHLEDADTGLVYMQQRYYDPSVGRFLSVDPVDASGTDGSNLDRYWYAKDNPYRYTDPTGMCTGSLIANPDTTCAFSGDFTTQASNAHLPGASASQRASILGLQQSAGAQGQRNAADTTNSQSWDGTWGGVLSPAAYQGRYHDELVHNLASGMTSQGANVLTEVKMCLRTACARIDILGRSPTGDLFGLEVKTGSRPSFTPEQLTVYLHLRPGRLLISPDNKILRLGLVPGLPLPPIDALLLYQRDASSPPFTVPLP